MAEIENLKIGNGGTLHIVGNEDIVANSWQAGKTYVKNKSYVIREHRLYVCNVTHTSVKPFDATKWTEIRIGDAIAANTTAIGNLSALTTSVKSSLVGAVNEAYSYKSGDTITLSNYFVPCVYDTNRLRAFINLPKAVRNCSFSCSYLEVYINSTDSVQTNNITNIEAKTRTPNQLWVQFTGNFTNVSNNNAGIAVISGTITFT